MEDLELTIDRPKNIDDKHVLEQIDAELLAKLGEQTGTDYDLKMNRRDIQFTNGIVKYYPYRTKVLIQLNQ